MKKFLVTAASVLGVFLLIGAVLVSLRKKWVEPYPGVDLTPRRPDLAVTSVAPGSAYDLLGKASALPGDIVSFWQQSDPTAKVRKQGWPERWDEVEAPADPEGAGGTFPREETVAQDDPGPFDENSPWTDDEIRTLKAAQRLACLQVK